jgi:uncharacterized protein HemY
MYELEITFAVIGFIIAVVILILLSASIKKVNRSTSSRYRAVAVQQKRKTEICTGPV